MDERQLQIVLVEPEIPQNTGNIGRTCVALGAKLWLVRPLGFRLDEHHLRRAGLDYWEHLEYELVDHWEQFVERIGARRLWYFSRHAERSYLEASYSAGDALVFGSETRGLPRRLWQSAPRQALRIPMRPAARSLNLSNAVALAAYEVLRQTGGGWSDDLR